MKQTQRGGKNRGGRNWLWIAIAPIAVMSALALAACGGDSSDDDGDSATAATSGAGASETVAVETIGNAGDVLVNADGAALYTSEQEESGKVVCAGECLSFWEPVTVADGESPSGPADVEGDLGTVMRPDGDTQVTFDGAPLYSFTDEGPGEVTGDGFVDAFDGTEFTWHVAMPTGASAGGGGSSASQDTGGGLYDY
jgi:predicted lipoprotein with Yx(FWY)xxD motif